MADSAVFLDEAPAISRRSKREAAHQEFADTLRQNPGKWRLLGEKMSTASIKAIKEGAWDEFAPAGSFDAVSRNNDVKGKGDIYVTFVA